MSIRGMKRRAFIAALGCAAVWPMVARGQQPATPVTRFLVLWSPGEAAYVVAVFREGLGETMRLLCILIAAMIVFPSFLTSSLADSIYFSCSGTFDSTEPYGQIDEKAGPITITVDQEKAVVSVGGQQPWAIAKDGSFAGSFVDETGLWGGVKGARLYMDGRIDSGTGQTFLHLRKSQTNGPQIALYRLVCKPPKRLF